MPSLPQSSDVAKNELLTSGTVQRRNETLHKEPFMYPKILTTAALTAMLMVSGCAAFKANQLPTVTAKDLGTPAETKTKVFSRWNVQSNSSLLNEQGKAAVAAIQKKNFEMALNSSGCCVIVEGPTEADVVINGTSFAENNPAAMIPAFITGLSLYTIPSWVTAKIHLGAEVKKGETTRNYDVQDSMTMVQWLPMIFAMPFKGSALKTAKEVDENTHKSLVLKIKQDGLI